MIFIFKGFVRISVKVCEEGIVIRIGLIKLIVIILTQGKGGR